MRTSQNDATISSTASQPLKRIYFDTNILYRWPHPPNDIYSIFGVAKWLGAQLLMPEVVEGELEAQFIRSVNAAYDAAEQNIREINKLCRDVITVDIAGTRPEETDFREAFRKRSDELKAHFGISIIPLPAFDVRMFVDMAISRTAHSESESRQRYYDVINLQHKDAMILFPVLDHIRAFRMGGDRCALISNDKIFHAAETRKLVQLTGNKLETFKKVSAFDDLYNHVWDATRTAWHAEMSQIEAALNADKDNLLQQIFPLLKASDVGQRIWKRAKEVTGFSVSKFRYVLTELPESEHRPPHAETYSRPEGSEVKISAKAFTQIEAVVETTNWLGLFAFQGMQPPDDTPKIENATFTETLNVSLTGTV